MIPAQPLRSTISTPTMTTSSAPSTIRLSTANIPFSTTTTNSAPSTIRVSTANIPSSTNGFILSSSSNEYFSNTTSFNTLLYPTAKPSTGLYPSTAGMNTYGSNLSSH